jgi:hypothetical protein
MGVTCSGYVCSAVQGGGKRRWLTGTIGVSVRPAQCYDQRVGVFAHIPAMANPVFRVELRMARSSSSDRLDLITQFRAAVFELANLLRQLPKFPPAWTAGLGPPWRRSPSGRARQGRCEEGREHGKLRLPARVSWKSYKGVLASGLASAQ